MKREFYLNLLSHSILRSLEQLSLIDQELPLLEHQKVVKEQEKEGIKMEPPPRPAPFTVYHIPKGAFDHVPYMLHQEQGSAGGGGAVVQEYVNPGLDRIKVEANKASVDDRIGLKQQYQQQVFQADTSQPTMSIEELADREMRDAMERQRKDQEREQQEEHSSDEEVMERQRKKDLKFDEWKDDHESGSGNTKRI